MRTDRVRIVLAGALSFALLAAPIARAESEAERSLQSAAALYESLEYEQALEQLRRARNQSRTPEDDVRVSLYQGTVLADMGKRAAALKSFRTALLLDPDAKIPIPVSPKVLGLLEHARRGVHKQLRPGGLKRLRMARDARARAAAAKAEEEAAPPPPKPEPSPVESPPSVAAIPEPPVAPLPPPEPLTVTRPSIRAWAWLPGIAGLAAAGGGTYLYLEARKNYRLLDGGLVSGASEANTVRIRGQNQQTGAFVLLGVGAAGLLTAGALLIWGGPREVPVPTAWASPDGGGVMVSGRLP